ncbi:hypothetical protein MRS44_004283 [Fusarium solani]|uniref:Uncharacterized protein n=1 Tax=Fusarium solani TaxID=169388 RepID=A0A9P9GED6_FUSSL|nr:uncharacterized protein B0J15DRAFT_503713 [Fusarium solani]KAH7237381.1 hypothetical protein B0J15DRAFT_503713 [Fusarium solani]KAJ3466719.1 hypothetical protein MRS44_004283 [Fusarium solani]
MFKNKPRPVPTHDTDPSTDEEDNVPFISEEDDPLIPSASDVRRTFRDGKAMWDALFQQAKGMPRGLWPTGMLDPYIALMDVPSLPGHLPTDRILYGRPRWRLSPDIASPRSTDQDDDGPTLRYGRRLAFFLQAEDPIRSSISQEAASYSMGLDSTTTDSLAVLTMCWSYILSVRVLEMQDRQVCYSSHHLSPQQHERPMIHLDGASSALVRWLCAILSPEFGWGAKDEGKLPMFAAFFNQDAQIVIGGAPISTTDVHSAPSSSEAMELLIELCRLFHLGTERSETSEWEAISPYRAGFLAALVLPFYTFMDLQPQLPTPRLPKSQRGVFKNTHEQEIRQYHGDLRYFMALGSHPPSVGSVLWSIFWQPDVECNLVGPWLSSILEVLKPAIKQKHVEVILKLFIARRPRVAIWWVAIILLGDLTVLDCVQRYTQKLEEKGGTGSMAAPDPIVSAWTGAKQSFLDDEKDATYGEKTDLVSRADVLRCRFDLKLQDYASVLLAWRPFGYIQKGQVEVELWPQLETKYVRQYHSFVWYPERDSPSTPEHGFRHDTGRDVKNVPDNLDRPSTGIVSKGSYQPPLNIRPSRISTRRMLNFFVEDAVGRRDWANAVLPVDQDQLRWLFHWENPDPMRDSSSSNGSKDGGSVRSTSWFVGEWINGRFK